MSLWLLADSTARGTHYNRLLV